MLYRRGGARPGCKGPRRRMTTRPRGSTVEAEQQGAGRLAIPEAGLREYWYPAARAKDVPRARPLEVRLLGEDLVLFRAPGGSVGAIDAVCHHRGGRIADGRDRPSTRLNSRHQCSTR